MTFVILLANCMMMMPMMILMVKITITTQIRYDMLKNMDPPLGFGSKCPDRLAYKKLIR